MQLREIMHIFSSNVFDILIKVVQVHSKTINDLHFYPLDTGCKINVKYLVKHCVSEERRAGFDLIRSVVTT
jgi:hypothetical protein